MRLFTAVELEQEARAALGMLQRSYARSGAVRMTPPESLHLTLRFFGEWPEQRLPELIAALDAIPAGPALRLQPLGLRFLPTPASPRVFILLLEARPELLQLQRAIEEQARSLGMEPERRVFLPHITLGRVRDVRQAVRLAEALREAEAPALEAIDATNFALIQSTLGPQGAVYRTLRRWDLTPPA
ncbi:MAG: RNA 2',3'-cyclic phosphodiesterase [Acidobacteria bacterium]|nr:RNA 2',3'-cyclic phosphodiesterase [Acidobacteriota bacterium]